MATLRTVKLVCQRCGTSLLKQGGNIYFCPNCRRYFRLTRIVPIFDIATYEDAQDAMEESVKRFGLRFIEGSPKTRKWKVTKR